MSTVNRPHPVYAVPGAAAPRLAYRAALLATTALVRPIMTPHQE